MKFTTKQKQELKKKGYLIFFLSGKSLGEMKNKVYSSWHREENFGKEKGRKMEVAFNPKSEMKYNLTYDEAQEEAKKPTGIAGTHFEILSISEYVEFNNLFYQKTGKELEGWYTWTNTKFEDGLRLLGGYSDLGGLSYVDRDWSGHRHDVFAFRPLVVSDLESLEPNPLAVPLDISSLDEKLDKIEEKLDKLMEHLGVGEEKEIL